MKTLKQIGLLLVFALPALTADQALLSLVEKDSPGVAGIYVDKALTSPMGRFVLTQIRDDGHMKKFIEATGFDPRRDLRELVFSLKQPPSAKGHLGNGLVIARGVFNAAQIIAEARTHGSTVESFDGVQVVRVGKGETSFAFLDGGIGLFGPDQDVRAAIKRRGQSVALTPSILSQVNKVSAANDIWFVGVSPAKGTVATPPGLNPSVNQQIQVLQAIEQTSGGVRFGSTVDVECEAVARSEKDAQALVDVVRFVISLAQGQGGSNTKGNVLSLLDRVNVSSTAATVRLTFSVAQTELEQFIMPHRAAEQARLNRSR